MTALSDQWQRVTTDEDGRVTDLDLGSNQLNGEIPTGLGDLSNLKLLYVSDNNLTGVLPKSLTRIICDWNRSASTTTQGYAPQLMRHSRHGCRE